MAVTKDEFMQFSVNEIANYPTIATRFQIGDPLIIQGMASMAAMLTRLSDQVEVTGAEPFIKARDVTVRADAAVKGILPFATPSIAQIKVTNGSSETMRIIAGRTLLDQQGRYWLVIGGATLLASSVGYMTAKQVKGRVLKHSVSVHRPFYTVDLPEPELGFIASVLVTGFEYSTNFANTLGGEKVFNIKSDENGFLSLQFGVSNLSGYQPAVGETLTVTIQDTEGALSLSVGMKFAFEYVGSAQESKLLLELSEVTQTGADPMDINTMREVCSYPAIFDDSAVFLSNFDYVVRKKIARLTFLSIWNEAREETVRGPSVRNINSLFVAVRKDGTADDVVRQEVEAIIKRADSSYRVVFKPVKEVVVGMKLLLSITSVYDGGAVTEEVRTLILDNYGRDSAWAKRGEAKILEKDVYKLLVAKVAALNPRMGNLVIKSISSPEEVLPEHYRFVTEQSLVIEVEEAD